MKLAKHCILAQHNASTLNRCSSHLLNIESSTKARPLHTSGVISAWVSYPNTLRQGIKGFVYTTKLILLKWFDIPDLHKTGHCLFIVGCIPAFDLCFFICWEEKHITPVGTSIYEPADHRFHRSEPFLLSVCSGHPTILS